jgi:uncharacterized protein YdcH (DUF465 family)
MNLRLAIMTSLAASAVMAMWIYHDTTTAPTPIETIPVVKLETVATAAPGIEIKAATNDATPTTNQSTSQTEWKDIDAEELKLLVTHLRAVHCPEETIKDIVLGRVENIYGARTTAIFQDQEDQSKYWKPFNRKFTVEMAKKNAAQMEQYKSLQKEMTALIVELFGVDVEKERREQDGNEANALDYLGQQLAYLPEIKRESAQKILESFNQKQQEFYASISGSWDSTAREKQKQLEQEKLDGLAQILTPQELREYELRSSQNASQLISELHGVSLSRSQYEALYDIRAKYGDSIYNYGDDGNSPEKIKQIEQNKLNLKSEIAAALGPDKAKEFDRANDYTYRQLSGLATHENLPDGTAAKVYDFKQQAEDAVKAIRENKDLTSDQRQSAFYQIRQETEASVKTTLGEKAYKLYGNHGGWWLNNLGPGKLKKK